MTQVNPSSNNPAYNLDNIKTQYQEGDIKLEDISILYTTTQQEDERTTISESFTQKPVHLSEAGQKFLKGLIDNKATLCEDLGLNDEQYDTLACVALALASQETGMGEESGYVGENTGVGWFMRYIGKNVESWFKKNSSASSGLTQMKIFDFLNGSKLTNDQKQILRNNGVEAKGVATNNLFDEPDKSAIATMVVLSSIAGNYENYTDVLKAENKNIEARLADVSTNPVELKQQGDELVSNILDVYQNAPDNQKEEIRETFKQWLLSYNDTKIGDRGDKNFNEEYQMNELNKLLAQNSADFKLDENSLDLVRYSLTSSGAEMTVTEYCAYGWNKGTTGSGMQLDRMLAEKVGIILENPEDLDYNQFNTNVSTLAEMYAQQSNGTINNDVFEDLFY